MLKPPPEGLPHFRGVDTFSDHLGRFKFRVPFGWQREELDDERDGMMFLRDPDDPDTHISCWITKLEHAVKAEDLDLLRNGVEEGLGQLPGCTVESRSDDSYGNLIKFERVFTYGEEGPRKRKAWYLYAEVWMIVLAWQGATPDWYEYGLPMGNYAFATMDVPDWLWLATDRDLGFRP
ncbi:MAG TPA: hypothetical protein VIA06_23815 [Candidatus Dormibacteraeota bacterium]|nr:hypothetical protein [Candidatus Dormibacteraeota bacterium]